MRDFAFHQDLPTCKSLASKAETIPNSDDLSSNELDIKNNTPCIKIKIFLDWGSRCA